MALQHTSASLILLQLPHVNIVSSDVSRSACCSYAALGVLVNGHLHGV